MPDAHRDRDPSGGNAKHDGGLAMRWTEVQDIAIGLEEKHPGVDVVNLRFTDLHKWVVELIDFDDDPKRSNEKILEAIQMAWLDERD